jgi:hypothetical protein
MKQALFILTFLFFCAGPPKYLPPEVPAGYSTIYVEPFRNMSTIELSKGFPRDSVRIQVIFQEIEMAHKNMVREISLQGKRGGYRVTEDIRDFPTIIVTPVLMPYKQDGRNLELPIFLKIADKEKGTEYKFNFEIKVSYPRPEVTDNSYHYWGVMLAEWRRNFPYKKIAALFYGKKKGEEQEKQVRGVQS